MTVSPAGEGDLSLVLNILDQAAQWLSSQGIHQWDSPPPAEVCRLFELAIARQDVYLVRLGTPPEVIGAFRLDWSHADFWPDRKDAGYLYTLALKPDFIGRGIGKRVIDWVDNQIRGRRRDWLRLDCIAANKRLRRWYEDLGFQHRGDRDVNGYELALYERMVGRTPQVEGSAGGSSVG